MSALLPRNVFGIWRGRGAEAGGGARHAIAYAEVSGWCILCPEPVQEDLSEKRHRLQSWASYKSHLRTGLDNYQGLLARPFRRQKAANTAKGGCGSMFAVDARGTFQGFVFHWEGRNVIGLVRLECESWQWHPRQPELNLWPSAGKTTLSNSQRCTCIARYRERDWPGRQDLYLPGKHRATSTKTHRTDKHDVLNLTLYI